MLKKDLISKLSEEQVVELLNYTPEFSDENLANIKARALDKINFMEESDMKKSLFKRSFFRSAIALATTAAVVCLVMFGGNVLRPQNTDALLGINNSFKLTALAMEQHDDGSVIPGGELEIIDGRIAVEFDDRLEVSRIGVQGIFANDDFLEGDLLGEIISTGLGFRLDGENIVRATLTADQGFFQVIRTDNHTYWNIDRVDGAFELNDASLSSLLIWGYEHMYDVPIPLITRGQSPIVREVGEGYEHPTPYDRITATSEKLPETVVFTAVVTFEDGEEQVKSITFNPRDVWKAFGVQIESLPPPGPNPDGTWG